MKISKFVPRSLSFLRFPLWVAAIGVLCFVAWQYSTTPGLATDAPRVWPASSSLHLASDRHTLLMFVLTQCSCSRASLTELNNTIHDIRHQGRDVSTIVVFNRPEGAEPDLTEGLLRSQAGNLPDAVIVDDTAIESELFGAHTSGATLLFDSAGTLLFTGGVTSVRGHEGDSFGRERIVSLVTTGSSDRANSPIFGCELEDKEEGDE